MVTIIIILWFVAGIFSYNVFERMDKTRYYSPSAPEYVWLVMFGPLLLLMLGVVLFTNFLDRWFIGE